MKVEIAILNKTKGYCFMQDIQEWDRCDTTSEVYHSALREYGRCQSKVYIDDGQHVGWVFEKKCYYEDTQEPYIQETWVTPLKSYEVKHIKEYALS